MSLRSLFLVPLFALATPVAADRLLVAGPDGFVMQADTADGIFDYFACQCSGPIRALAADDQRLYTADDFGQILMFDVNNGALVGVAFPGMGQINALAAAEGQLFAGTEDGLVLRIDPSSGQVLDTRLVPTSVRALLAHDGFLIAGGTDGAIYRAPVAQGDFAYFTCFCFSAIRAIVAEAGDLVVVDEFGLAARVSAETGVVETAFFVGATNVMAASDGALLLYYDGGTIPLVDAQTGQSLPGGFQSPIAVDAMLVLEEAPQGKAPPALRNPRKPKP